MNEATSSPQVSQTCRKQIKIPKNKSQNSEISKETRIANVKPQVSNSYIRTTTFPRLFKGKFFSKYNQSSTSSTLDSTASNISNQSPTTRSNMSVSTGKNIIKNHNNSQSSSITNSSVCSATSSTSELNKLYNETESTVNSVNTMVTSLRNIHSKQLHSLNKYVEKFSKAIKYLDQIILKKKYEIIASSITAILEAVLDIYNVIQSFEMHVGANHKTRQASFITSSKKFNLNRMHINKSLANLIKWSDSILFLNSVAADTNELLSEKSLYDSARSLISELNGAIKHMVKYLKKLFVSQEIWSERHMDADVQMSILTLPINADMCLSSSSTSSFEDGSKKQEKLPEVLLNNSVLTSPLQTQISSVTNKDFTKVKTSVTKTVDNTNAVNITHTTVKSTTLPSNTQVTQTTTISTTTSSGNSVDPFFNINTDLISNPVRLSSFIDLDRLAIELSSLGESSTITSRTKEETFLTPTAPLSNVAIMPFTNEHCNYLLTQFESFAKDFKKKETSNNFSSRASTVDTKTDLEIKNSSSKKTSATVYSNKLFKQSTDRRVCATEEIHNGEEECNSNNKTLISKTIEYKNNEKVNFKETNILLNDIDTNQLLKTVIEMSPEDLNKNDKTVNTRDLQIVTDPIKTFTTLFDDPDAALLNTNKSSKISEEKRLPFEVSKTKLDDSVDDEVDDDGNINDLIFGVKNLNSTFLLIDDEDDDILTQSIDKKNNTRIKSGTKKMSQFLDDELNNYNDRIDPLLSSKPATNNSIGSTWSLSSATTKTTSSSNSSLASSPPKRIQSLTIPTTKTSRENSQTPTIVVGRNQTEPDSVKPGVLSETVPIVSHSLSSISSSFSSLSKPFSSSTSTSSSSQANPTTPPKVDCSVLSLLDVSHLIEYQVNPTSTNTATATIVASPSVNTTTQTNILRGGHIDALIVLASSAQTGVVSVQMNNTAKSNAVSGNSANILELLNSNRYVTNRTQWQADSNAKNNFLFQEAFLTTYRTIIDPVDLMNKLIYRYRFFSKYPSTMPYQNDTTTSIVFNTTTQLNEKFDFNRIRTSIKNNKLALSAAKNSLALLVRVLDDLGNELNEKIFETLADFVYELLLDDELQLARLLRKKLINKLDLKRLQEQEKETKCLNNKIAKNGVSNTTYSASLLAGSKQRGPSLLDFKSLDLAEQMTLIDLELFSKIELSEVLLWSTKQNEESSPNLILFTEHFNNISYWARSRILENESFKDREKYMIKFLKIMKHLRKMNNFNSYLSILSAVDSGPIQRLDWPKNIIDSIKEFSVLIDPKCGFKSLREAMNEAQPPCIPHIGLVLQDLTILHIANSDYLSSGNCNFWKRWQQFNILERLRYFRRCNYGFKKNAKIHDFFNNFEDFFNEDTQYSLSEQLKPRNKTRQHTLL